MPSENRAEDGEGGANAEHSARKAVLVSPERSRSVADSTATRTQRQHSIEKPTLNQEHADRTFPVLVPVSSALLRELAGNEDATGTASEEYPEVSQSVRENTRKIMFKRTSFQAGSLKKEKRKRGPDVWIYRFREIGPDGQSRKPKVILGTVEQFPTQALAKRAIEALGISRGDSKHQPMQQFTMTDLITHYAAKELSAGRAGKTPYTCDVYRGYFKTWISPRWGHYTLKEVKTSEVESWLRSIERADGTKVKIRNLMSTLFNHAIRWEFASLNPISGPNRGSGVRQSGKRRETPVTLSIEEIRSILDRLPDRHRTLVFLIACTGLRFSELRGLKWMDFNVGSLSLSIRRGVVKGYLGDLKTRASHRVLPLHEELVSLLVALQASSPHKLPDDWIFASTQKNGRIPVWPNSLMEDHIRPAAHSAGIDKHINWKAFRASIATQLNANGEDVKTSQQTLGHANSRITLDVYMQAIPSTVRLAHDRIVDMVMAEPNKASSRVLATGPLLAPQGEEALLSC
jgi:integrase